jgi:FAD synthase
MVSKLLQLILFSVDNEAVSSTRIRKALEAGNLPARPIGILGRYYSLTGKVSKRRYAGKGVRISYC